MFLKFYVDQNESIRRGFDTESTVKIQIPIPELSKEQCAFLGDRFCRGFIMQEPTTSKDPRGLKFLTIKEPTLSGVIEAIEAAKK